MEKIKAFFTNKITKLVCWVILALDIACLIIGGATTEAITSSVALVSGIIAAVAALVAFIIGQIKRD
jgi:hypothetical protein